MLAYIYPINPATGLPDQSLPGFLPPVDPGFGIPGYGGGYPGQPLPPFPGRPGQPLPKPPSIWNPDFPYLPIVIPPVLPPGIVAPPNFPTNPIVIPPLPVTGIPEGKILVLAVTSHGARWGVVDLNAIVAPPIYNPPDPEPK